MIHAPLPTVTCKSRFGIAVVYGLDIKFRMLRPRELACGMGFPKSYIFAGPQDDQIKQIGNAVSVNMAEALIGVALDNLMPIDNDTDTYQIKG